MNNNNVSNVPSTTLPEYQQWKITDEQFPHHNNNVMVTMNNRNVETTYIGTNKLTNTTPGSESGHNNNNWMGTTGRGSVGHQIPNTNEICTDQPFHRNGKQLDIIQLGLPVEIVNHRQQHQQCHRPTSPVEHTNKWNWWGGSATHQCHTNVSTTTMNNKWNVTTRRTTTTTTETMSQYRMDQQQQQRVECTNGTNRISTTTTNKKQQQWIVMNRINNNKWTNA